MEFENNKKIIVAIIVLITIIGFFEVPYGVYQLKRVFIFISFLYLAYNYNKESIYFKGLIGFSLIFNPIIPLYLSREIWIGIDVVNFVFMTLLLKNNEDK